ncbi:MAG: B12-binding domain-containing radical SAM protein [Pseudomonadales bacterium]
MTVINSIVLVCLTPRTDANELDAMELPSYGIKRIQAAVKADPELQHCSLKLIDHEQKDVETYVADILACEPDLVGFSVYVWSAACLIEVARQIKAARPQCLIIFGGPSARKEVFDLPIYPDPVTVLDALVSSEGEIIFNQIAKLTECSTESLSTIPGIDMPLKNGWHKTAPAPAIGQLDHIASPYQLGIMPERTVAYLETFRGCPMGCRFCEWGASDKTSKVFSTEYLIREFHAYQKWQASSVFLVDAGLNLNARAFGHLREAEQETHFLQDCSGFWAEIYPTNIRDEHLQFLSNINVGYLGIGLQSIDPKVLKDQDRPFKMERFETAVRKLAEVAYCELQIIMGLPGDTPEGFKQTLAFARSLPAGVRAYHCLVLPDALLSRSKPEWHIQFDMHTSMMTSCTGWSEQDFTQTREYNNQLAKTAGGTAGDFWWFYPPQFR